jgi:flap endonuclease-1
MLLGVQIGDLILKKEISLPEISGKIIGVDGNNVSYQFLTRIRQIGTGKLLRDNKGRITSHLTGIFYRTSNFLEAGIKPVFIWDGKPPRLKNKTIIKRRVTRAKAKKRWMKALKKGEDAMSYAQASSKLTLTMVEEAIQLLDYMGIPSIRAPSEGEAQLAMMAREGDIWASASQDWDSLLFNSPRLVRNLSITGRRKVPQKQEYITIKPEIVELEKVLQNLGINREQLITIGILIGTDYNSGIKGVGPKTALRLIKKHKTINHILENVTWNAEVDFEEVYNYFLNPPVFREYDIRWKKPNSEKLLDFMVEEHDFSRKRVENVINILEKRIVQKPKLEDFFN